jgi:Amt family ammonium transporter
MKKSPSLLLTIFVFFASTLVASAQEAAAPVLDAGNTAWILAATALVLFMTIPGLALFYGGLVHKRNVLSVLMHCFALTCVMSIVWLVAGYSLSFSGSGEYIGDFAMLFGKGLNTESVGSTGIPDILFFAFQMTFFVITPALVIGTFVERVKFSAVLIFSVLWGLLVYAPVCHMVWAPGGWFFEMGVFDLAGGIVVHITAGVAALIFCIMIGPRKNPMPPHNLPMTITGTAMLWVGWFGFNGGSGLAANGAGAMSVVVTHLSAATAACTWAAIEWYFHRRPSVLGAATGAIAGLAAITPAAGVAGPMGALLIGLLSGAICYYFSVKVKNKFKYDDSLDVVGVHGVGGLLGTIMAAVVASKALQGLGGEGYDMGAQLGKQALASGVVLVFTAVVSFAIIKLIQVTVGLRVTDQEENAGLDQTDHGETAYND